MAKSSRYTNQALPEFEYAPHSDPMQLVDAALLRAKQKDKKVLIALGADWCHDSVGFSRRFSTDQLAPIIKKHYETVFVDVGYLEDRRNITQRFGYGHYFATPTVLIINPETIELVNWESVKKWGFADSFSIDEYVNYFQEFAEAKEQSLPYPANRLITDFANDQSARLQAGYDILGPLLAADERGERNDAFLPMWKEVRGFRMTLQEDLVSLNKQSLQSAKTDKTHLPEYGPFSWEK